MASAYAPNNGPETFLIRAVGEVVHSPGDNTLMGGNLNIVMNTNLDRSGQRFGQAGAVTESGHQWLKEIGLFDLWRVRNRTTKDYTFFSASHKTYARLDYFLGSPSVLDLVTDTDIHPMAQSDHTHTSIVRQLPSSPIT